jgi:hypothetical protein
MAVPTGTDQRRNHVIARSEIIDTGTNGINHTRCLVSVNRRQASTPGTIGKKDVTVTDRAGSKPDPELILRWFRQVDLLYLKGGTKSSTNGRFHRLFSTPAFGPANHLEE